MTTGSTSWQRTLGSMVIGLTGMAVLWAGFDQLLRSQRENYEIAMRWIGASLLGLSGVVILALAWRWWQGLWSSDIFWRRAVFYRWLLGGWWIIFLSLGLTIGHHDEARFVCRGVCLFWLGLCLFPASFPGGWRKIGERLHSIAVGRGIDVLLGNVVLLLFLGEVGLRSLAAWKGEDSLLLFRSEGCRLQPGRQGHGQLGNSLGFPGPEFVREKPAGTFRVAALGDSFSVATAVPYEEAYLTLLGQTWQGVEVLNFGVAGTSPKEYRLLLNREVWDYQPDLILLPIFVGNDILEPVIVPKLHRFNPNALYVELLLQRIYRLVRERVRLAEAKHHGDAHPAQSKNEASSPIMSERTYRELLARHVAICRNRPDRIDEQLWRDCLHHVGGIIEDARQRGIPILVLLLPDELQVNEQMMLDAWRVRGWPDQERQVDYANQRLAAFLKEKQVPYLDLLPILLPLGSEAYAPRDTHWNALGNRVVAEAAAQWMELYLPSFVSRIAKPSP